MNLVHTIGRDSRWRQPYPTCHRPSWSESARVSYRDKSPFLLLLIEGTLKGVCSAVQVSSEGVSRRWFCAFVDHYWRFQGAMESQTVARICLLSCRHRIAVAMQDQTNHIDQVCLTCDGFMNSNTFDCTYWKFTTYFQTVDTSPRLSEPPLLSSWTSTEVMGILMWADICH